MDPGVAALALVAYVPLLLTRPGMVGADTKTYLYLDPGRLLSRAPFMWDPNVGLGTVTHQNIGYLWPMGPYYFVMQTLGLPDWVAQRLWLGSIILAAGLGVRWMLRELRWEGAGITVAAFSYALSPYLLDYAARISVILLPFAGLPWLIGLAARSLRRGGWQAPAVFALVTLTVGGVNATSLVLVMVGPILWFVHATFVVREVSPADALRAGLRITVLTAITSLWWLVGLMIQGAHGIPILRYTETYETVAAAALAPELLRGLGYWFFYGRDGLGAWTASSVALVESVRALALSYLLPWLGFVSAVLTRFRHRVFFAGIVAIGLVLGVGAHPWDSPSPWGSAFKAWSTSDLGLSFRSTPRSVPLIALGLSVFLGAGAAAVSRWRPRLRQPVAVLLILLICANMAPLFRGQMVDRNLMRDEQLPDEWLDAAAALGDGDTDTRALEFPGIDFAAYRWGNTVDPITPGLTDREFVARELIPYGSPPSANLLNDLDQPFQAGRPDPDTLAPLAQMMGIGDIVRALRPAVRALPHAAAPTDLDAAAGSRRSGRAAAVRRSDPERARRGAPPRRRARVLHARRRPRPATGVAVPRAGPPGHHPLGHRHRPGADGRERRGDGGAGVQRRTPGRSSVAVLRVVRRGPVRTGRAARRTGRQPGGHRHQPTSGATVGFGPGQRRLHRACR